MGPDGFRLRETSARVEYRGTYQGSGSLTLLSQHRPFAWFFLTLCMGEENDQTIAP